MKVVKVLNGRAVCPSCGQKTEVMPRLQQLNIHFARGASICPGAKEKFEFVEARNRKPRKTTESKEKHEAARERFERRQEKFVRKAQGKGHWRDEYAIACEDSWGNDNLGAEGGQRSVRAYSGGRTESNRRKH